MPEPEEPQLTPVAEDGEDQIETDELGRPVESIEELNRRMQNANPFNLDQLFGKNKPKTGVKVSDTGEILDDSDKYIPPKPDQEDK